MKSLTQRVAEFCKRPNGAISSEVAENFGISQSDARGIMKTIRKSERYSIVETKDKHRIRVHVTSIRKHMRHAVAVVAKNIITGDEYRFESIAEADSSGGFCQRSIRNCLGGKQSSHAGYYWKRA
ncbi:MAG: hypothetical protein ACRCXB_14725 [Aeromonadaceae bacterium]